MRPVAHNLIRFLPILCLAAYAVLALGFWVDDVWHPEWDGAIYLLTAESLAQGQGYLYQGEPFFLRPPGLSWILSLLVGADGIDPYRVNLLLTAFAVAAVLAIYWALRALHGRWIALAVALLTGTSPIFADGFNDVLSEFPFLALLFAGIALLTRAASRPAAGWPETVAGALCIAGALYLRTVAVLILPGVLLMGWRARSMRTRAPVAVLFVALLGAPWIRFSSAAAERSPVPAEQLFLHDYGTAMFHVDPGDPGSDRVDLSGWTERIRKNGRRATADLTRLLGLGAGPLARGVFVGLALIGFALALRRRPTLLEWWAPIYTLLVLTYFTYAERLSTPLAPLVYLYLLLTLRSGADGLARRTRRPALMQAAAAGVVLALLAANVLRLEPRPPLSPAHEDQLDIAAWIRANTAPEAVLLCNQAPVFEWLTGRRCYTFRFLRRAQLLGRYELDLVLFDQPNERLFQAVREGPTERETIRTRLGSRVPVFRIPARR